VPSVFTMIIEGDIPGRFVRQDEAVVAFLSIGPITHGHTLVVPRVEVDHWIDLDDATWARVGEVTKAVGSAIQQAFDPPRVGTMIAGFEVPHVHVHVLQIHGLDDLDFAKAATDPDPASMDAAADDLRTALRELGHAEVVPEG